MIVDTARLGTAKPAPGGGVVVPARIGRSGVQVYRRPDGTVVRAYRPADEVRVADYSGAPITVGHPAEGVTPENWRQLSVGVVRAQAGQTERVGRHEFARAELQVSDGEAIKRLGNELVECSCAYTCSKDWTPGVADGEAYDVVFRGLVPNHVALGSRGFARAGREARLIADGESAEDQLMSDVLIADGADATAPPKDDRDKLVADAAVLQAKHDGLVKDNERLTAELEAAKDKCKTLQGEVDDLPRKIADGVKAELDLRKRVAPLVGDSYEFDGKTSRQIKVDAIKALVPEKTIADDVSELWLDVYLEAAADRPAAKDHDHNESHGVQVQDGQKTESSVAARSRDVFFLNARKAS